MKPWTITWSSLVLYAAGMHAAAAQGVFGSIFPAPASWFEESIKFPEAKPFGADLKQLPGQRITRVAMLEGKWAHNQMRRNVQLDQVRVPQLSVAMLLDLQVDGTYTLDYRATWGGATPESRFATLTAREKGRFSLSGSVLLLESTIIEVTRDGRSGQQTETLDNERRAYIVRLEKSYLNLAGACAPYQAEDICQRYRNVWFSLPQLQASQMPASKQPTLPMPGR